LFAACRVLSAEPRKLPEAMWLMQISLTAVNPRMATMQARAKLTCDLFEAIDYQSYGSGPPLIKGVPMRA
jgi:hypothetical protein